MSGFTPHLLLLGMIILLFIWERYFPETVDRLEDNLLVFLMVMLTLVSFGQVIARYGFNTGWSAALEFNMVTFSWLILVGMSYGIKRNSHLGVDLLLKAVPRSVAKWLAIFGAATGLIYGLILLDAAWFQETFGVKDRVQRWIVLIILPISLALLSFRSLQAMVEIYRGDREMVIAGHEAEELVNENKDALKD
jgi:C4-dicarboxylate transporter DctQ subunit